MPEQIPVWAVRNGGTDYIEAATPEEAYVAALRRERAGYLQYDKQDRADAVTAELRRVGAEQDPAARPPAMENTADRTPLQRTGGRGRPRKNP
jgi:hypothetical protein